MTISTTIIPAGLEQHIQRGMESVRYDASRPFTVLVTGSRKWFDPVVPRMALFHVLFSARAELEVPEPAKPVLIHGAAIGLDRIASAIWASWGYPQRPFPVSPEEWRRYPNAAGNRRNARMVAEGADVCVAFPTSSSRGTWTCVEMAERAGIPPIIIPGR